MELIETNTMNVTCEFCRARSKTKDLSDFKEYGHTYPPTIFFICPDCRSESRVFSIPPRLLQHMCMKISQERGYSSSFHFANGVGVTAQS